jgi:hypothetical protein
MKCKWHRWTRDSVYGPSHACGCGKFAKTDYVTGNRLRAECLTHNSEGNCSGFEEKPPDPPKVGLLKRFFGSVPGPSSLGVRDG